MPRPAQLDDPDWLRARYRLAGYQTIATELGVSKGTVRRACVRLGLGPAPEGRRRGDRIDHLARPARTTHERVIARYQRERTLEGPAPTIQLVITRARDAVLAHLDGTPDLIDEALEALAVAALLALDHRQQVAALAA